MLGAEMMGSMVGSFIRGSIYKWLFIVIGIAAVGYIGLLKVENIRLKSQVTTLQNDFIEAQDKVDVLLEENEGLKIISQITLEQCQGMLKYEKEKPSRPGAETPITEEYLNDIFKGKGKQ